MGPAVPPPEFIAASMGGALLGIGIVLTIIWPFVGILTRLWANYTPKRIVLGDEIRGESGTLEFNLSENRRNEGYWAMFRRVKRVEGFGGLWKGAGVFAISILFTIILYALIVVVIVIVAHFFPSLRKTGIFVVIPVFIILQYFIMIPFRVLQVRAIATPKKLWVRQPIKAYRALLNPFERKNPLRLCLLPGVTFGIILADVVQTAIAVPRGISLARPRQFVVAIVLSTLVNIFMALAITPFHVAITRLSLQERNLPFPRDPIGEEGSPEADIQNDPQLPTYQEAEGTELTGAAEDVINIRSGQEPYKGFIDCIKCIAKEEGLRTLWRGWYILAIPFVLSEFPVRASQIPSNGGGGMWVLPWLSG